MSRSASRPRRDWSRRYAPLSGALLSVVMALFVLPSALNVPQSNPAQTLEFAPIPPDEDEPPPPDSGNAARLGLGSSSTVPGDLGGDPPEPPELATPPLPEGIGEKPVSKRCVGNPPRQTEDPMAPPCVAHFEGDNGGATHAGVTGDEIRVVAVHNAENVEATEGGWCDVDKPDDAPGQDCVDEDGATYSTVDIVRAFSNYFNARFQTYGRHVHLYVYWSATYPTPEERRADAAAIMATVEPFAVIDWLSQFTGGNRKVFAEEVARHDVLIFSGLERHPRLVYQRYPGRIWTFNPDIEHVAAAFSDYLCTRVAPYPVAHAEGGVDSTGRPFNGQPRRYGLWYSAEASSPNFRVLTDLVRDQIRACGIEFAIEGSFQYEGQDVFCSYATEDPARFKQEDVTTIIWTGDYDLCFGQGADAIKYYPEIVIAGDGQLDTATQVAVQNQAWFRNAWAVSWVLRLDGSDDNPGAKACREGNPSLPRTTCARNPDVYYRDYFMLFQAIQVAGSRLTPDNVDRGFHAIPPKSSSSPYEAACFFSPRDYACVKDQMEIWWDPTRQAPESSNPGCWRMVNGGQRHLIGEWPDEDKLFQDTPDAPCNGYGRLGF